MSTMIAIPPFLKMFHIDLTPVTKYAHPPQNYIGTTLFLLYIALALYATGTIVRSQWRKYFAIEPIESPTKKTSAKSPKKDKKDKKAAKAKPAPLSPEAARMKEFQSIRKRHIKIYAFLATISFAMLSSHMGMFLLVSYAQWGNFGPGGRNLQFSVEELKKWMFESSLFEGFAKELVADGPSAVWTQGALLGGWFWIIWMGQKAQQYSIPTRTLIPFILLSQILPISLTATLFIISLHLLAPELNLASNKKDTETTDSPELVITSPTDPYAKATPQPKKSSLTFPTILLNVALFGLPNLRHTRFFMPLVLITRLLLLTPFTNFVSLRPQQVSQSAAISAGFVVAQIVMVHKVSGGVGEVVRGVWTAGDAVRAVALDGLVGVAVHLCLGWGGGV